MGAFFLYRTSATIDLDAVRGVFREKGFSAPSEFDFGEYRLLHYNKQCFGVDGIVSRSSNLLLAAVGSPVYRGLGYRQGLETLLSDWSDATISPDELNGAFCLILKRGNSLSLLIDGAAIYHVYASEEGNVISSSFLAVLHSRKTGWTLDRDALLQNVTLGYVIAPKTLVKGIQRLIPTPEVALAGIDVQFPGKQKGGSDVEMSVDRRECLELQEQTLTGYFRKMEKLAGEAPIDVAMSGGFDSRLLLGSVRKLNVPVSLHSYPNWARQPLEDCAIAEMVAKTAGLPIVIPKLVEPPNMTADQFSRNLESAMYYFDGQTYVGWMRQVRTPSLRKELLGSSRLTLNGMGGELYRNHNSFPQFPTNTNEWLKYSILRPVVVNAFNHEARLGDFLELVNESFAKRLKRTPFDKVGALFNKRQYAEIWGSDMNGLVTSAENQLAFSLMPFAENPILRAGYKALPFLGSGVRFESELIQKIDPQLAGVISNYGFPPGIVPFQYKLKSIIGRSISYRAKSHKALRNLTRKGGDATELESLLKQHPILKDSLGMLEAAALPLDWRKLLQSRRHIDIALSVGYLLYRNQGRIQL